MQRAEIAAEDPTDLAQVAGWFDDRPALWRALDASARRVAQHAHPEHALLSAAADPARHAAEQAWSALAEAHRRRDQRLRELEPAAWTREPEARLAELDRGVAATRQELVAARARIATLTAEPTVRARPADMLTRARDAWAIAHDAVRAARRAAGSAASPPGSTRSMRPPVPALHRSTGNDPGIGR